MAPRGQRMMSNEERLSIDEKKRQGMSVKEIAKMFRRSSQTISKALKEISAMNGTTLSAEPLAQGPIEARRAAPQVQPALLPPTQQQHRFPQVMPLAVYDSLRGSVQDFPLAASNAPDILSAPEPSVAPGTINKAAGRRSVARAVQPRQKQTNPQGLLPPSQQRIQQQSLPLEVSANVNVGRREPEPVNPPVSGTTTSKIALQTPVVTETSVAPTLEATQAVECQTAQTDSPVVFPALHHQVQIQSLSLQTLVGASSRKGGPTMLAPPAIVTPNVRSEKAPTAVTTVQCGATPIAHAAQSHSEQMSSPLLPLPNQVLSATPPQVPQLAVAPISTGASGDRSKPISTAPPAIPKPVNGASGATSLSTPGVAAAGASSLLVGRRPITRPPRVFALTRPALMQKEAKGDAHNGSQDQGVSTKSTAAKSNAISTQHVARKAETMAPPDSNLMSLLLGIAPEDDTSPQTSQEDESASSQVGNLSRASNTSSEGEDSICISQVSLISKQSSNARATLYDKLAGGRQTKTRKEVETKKRTVQFLLSSLQDQVEDLQPEHIGDDTSKVYQLLSKFRDELGVLNVGTTPQSRGRKRKRDEDADNVVLGKLLHEKMAAEVALMNVQVQRERVQLDRERMKTEVEAALSRKKLEDASIPKSTIDSIFAQMMAN